jgi:hypothetical protein
VPFQWQVAITLFILLLPLLWLFFKDSLAEWRDRKTPQQLEAIALEQEQRLLNPDWNAVQNALEPGIVIPSALKAMYADTTLLLRNPFDVLAPNDVEFLIHGFFPADASAVRQDQDYPRNAFWFASGEIMGDYFVVLWNEDLPTPVFIANDEHGLEAVAPSLETFLGWARKAP